MDQEADDPLSLIMGVKYDDCVHPAFSDMLMETATFSSTVGPSKNLVLAAYLHRSLAQSSIASFHVFAPSTRNMVGMPAEGEKTNIGNRPQDRWFDRLPNQPRMEYLGLGLEHSSCEAYPQMESLHQHLFRDLALDPKDFVGYRCCQEYPVWGSQSMMVFDFEQARSQTSDDL